jgi:MFS-type transporter involved in bile tolerance (Atg22 family)
MLDAPLHAGRNQVPQHPLSLKVTESAVWSRRFSAFKHEINFGRLAWAKRSNEPLMRSCWLLAYMPARATAATAAFTVAPGSGLLGHHNDWMRRGLLFGVVLGVVNAASVVLLGRVLGPGSDFRGYSNTPMPPRYTDYLATAQGVTGVTAVGLLVAVLLGVNTVLVVGYLLFRRLHRDSG